QSAVTGALATLAVDEHERAALGTLQDRAGLADDGDLLTVVVGLGVGVAVAGGAAHPGVEEATPGVVVADPLVPLAAAHLRLAVADVGPRQRDVGRSRGLADGGHHLLDRVAVVDDGAALEPLRAHAGGLVALLLADRRAQPTVGAAELAVALADGALDGVRRGGELATGLGSGAHRDRKI